MMIVRGCVCSSLIQTLSSQLLVLLQKPSFFFKTLNIATHKKRRGKKMTQKKKVKNVSQSIFHRSIIDARAMMKKKT
jgi:hypothetical protein